MTISELVKFVRQLVNLVRQQDLGRQKGPVLLAELNVAVDEQIEGALDPVHARGSVLFSHGAGFPLFTVSVLLAPQSVIIHRLVNNNAYGVYFVFKSMEQGSTFRSSVPKFPTQDPNYRILARQRSRFTHYYFYVRDEVLGPVVIRVASFFPFQTTYYLNGHSFIEQQLNRRKIGFRKNDNAFLATDNVEQLQAGPTLRRLDGLLSASKRRISGLARRSKEKSSTRARSVRLSRGVSASTSAH